MRYEVYKSGVFWRWRLRGANSEILASGEAYYNKADVLHVIRIIKGSGSAPIVEV